MPDDSTAVRIDEQTKPPEGDVEEDLLDLDGEEVQSQPDLQIHQGDEPSEHLKDEETWKNARRKDNDEMQRSRSRSPHSNVHRRKKWIRNRTAELLHQIKKSSRMPNRIFSRHSSLREGDRFLRCAFCEVKGLHYSDSCPTYRTAKERQRMVRCTRCLDTLHRASECRRPVRRYGYCRKEEHHSAICPLPELKDALEKEYLNLREELKIIENDFNSTM
ncbi:hypothetical protein RB195_002678 [Necator americanus]|uniref:Uncharacterized protein n=1 Tax=Necator americanus TaxID=51031 RepID=A0ABR1DN05_NECAM